MAVRRREKSDSDPGEAVSIPVTDTLDLHAFRPSEVSELVTDYLELCFEKGILEVRIIHGKGTGSLRRTVEALLQRHPRVAAFQTADESAGGWGATLVTLQ